MPLRMEVGLVPGYNARWGPCPHRKKGAQQPPTFGNVYCVQTAECIKMSLGTETGLGAGDIVLDEDPAQGHSSPQHFLTHFALARSPILAAAGHLFSLPVKCS